MNLYKNILLKYIFLEWPKIGLYSQLLTKSQRFRFQNIVHNILGHKTFRMMGHTTLSNNVKFIKFGLSEYAEKPRFWVFKLE